MQELLISPKEVKEKLNSIFLLDVRNPDEYEIAKIKNSVLIPLLELESRFSEIPKDKEIIVYCHHGNRSMKAVQFLKEKGLNVKSIVGGIDEWSKTIDNSVLRY